MLRQLPHGGKHKAVPQPAIQRLATWRQLARHAVLPGGALDAHVQVGAAQPVDGLGDIPDRAQCHLSIEELGQHLLQGRLHHLAAIDQLLVALDVLQGG